MLAALLIEPWCLDNVRLRVGQSWQLRVSAAVDGAGTRLDGIPAHDWSTLPYQSFGITYDGNVTGRCLFFVDP